MYGYEAKRITDYELKLYKVKKNGCSFGKILLIDSKNGSKEIHYLIPDFGKLPIEERLCIEALIEDDE